MGTSIGLFEQFMNTENKVPAFLSATKQFFGATKPLLFTHSK